MALAGYPRVIRAAEMPSTSRSGWLVAGYLAAVGAAAVVALVLSELAHQWQHANWEQRYWLLSINHFRFHFVPLAVSGCWVVAKAGKRATQWLAQASAVLFATAIGSVAFWYNVGVELGTSTDPQRFSDAVHSRILVEMVLGAGVLVGVFGAVVGVARSFIDAKVGSNQLAG